MRKEGSKVHTPETVVEEIRRTRRRWFAAEQKIRIMLEGLRGEESTATLCRKEGLVPNLYYRWSKELLEAGKKAARRRHAAGGDLDGGRRSSEENAV